MCNAIQRHRRSVAVKSTDGVWNAGTDSMSRATSADNGFFSLCSNKVHILLTFDHQADDRMIQSATYTEYDTGQRDCYK